MSKWDLSYEVYCEWCLAKGDQPPSPEWYAKWMVDDPIIQQRRALERLRIEAEREERGER